MKLHFIIYLIAGSAIIWFSNYVNTRVEDSGMGIFSYVGWLFIIIGAFKLILAFILKEKNKTIKKTQTINKKRIISCPRCSVRHYDNSNYCHMCGAKLNK